MDLMGIPGFLIWGNEALSNVIIILIIGTLTAWKRSSFALAPGDIFMSHECISDAFKMGIDRDPDMTYKKHLVFGGPHPHTKRTGFAALGS